MSLIEIISWPFAKLLWLFNFTGNYAIAIFFFAIVVKLVTLPLSIKQQKTQIKGAKLRPKMAAIEKKYAGRTDRKTLEKKQKELMDLQQEEGYSPLSGCLPMLVQLPIIIILYNIIQNPLTHILGFEDAFVNANIHPFIPAEACSTQLKTLSAFFSLDQATLSQMAPDVVEKLQSINLNMFGLNLGVVPGEVYGWYIIIPVLTAVFSFLSSKITRKLMGQNPALQQPAQGDARTSNILMDLMMPLMSLWFAFKLPALLGIYWIYQSVLGVLQQYILNRAMPLPTYTEEEIRAILKAEKERANANRAAMRRNERDERSLHHIDDDDDDDDVYVPTIRSKFDDDDEDESPTAPQTAPKQPASHTRQKKKKK